MSAPASIPPSPVSTPPACEMFDLAPVPPDNPPGCDAVSCRMDTHATAIERMTRPLHRANDERSALASLARLDSSAAHDPALTLIDAWAAVVSVLTFYQERIANEAYLRTARERRSIMELARLVGYKPRPGVAAGVFLAYTLDKGHDADIPAGTKAQSVPGPNESAQTFETSAPLKARAAWNLLLPIRAKPQMFAPIPAPGTSATLEVKGSVANPRLGYPVLAWTDANTVSVRPILSVEQKPRENRTIFTLGEPLNVNQVQSPKPAAPPHRDWEAKLFSKLKELGIAVETELKDHHITGRHIRLAREMHPDKAADINAAIPDAAPIPAGTAFVFRIMSGLFGHNALPNRHAPEKGPHDLAPLDKAGFLSPEPELYLDMVYDIPPQSWVLVVNGDKSLLARVLRTRVVNRVDYDMVARVTALKIRIPDNSNFDTFFKPPDGEDGSGRIDPLGQLRNTVVYAGSEALELADIPQESPVQGSSIEIDGNCEGMEAGRWVIVTGRKTGDNRETSGPPAAEVAVVDRVERAPQPVLYLAEPLKNSYRIETVQIYGNVIEATHGETRRETLGSGDGNQPNQSFTLKQGPLTCVHAANSRGARNTLEVRVNGVRWHEAAAGLTGLPAAAREYVLETADNGATRICFGNGVEGACPPTGVQNIAAKYRVGIGAAGNVAAGHISLAIDRPLGVKDVLNPLPAGGGADREPRESARRNARRSTTVLDRLISAKDYERFTAAFSGVGKAIAAWIDVGDAAARSRQLCITVAGTTPQPLDPAGDLLANLLKQFRRAGDPRMTVQLVPHRTAILCFDALVRIDPDYLWTDVAPRLRADLVNYFGYDARDLGQPVAMSEIISRIQGCAGVVSVSPRNLSVAGRGQAAGIPNRVHPRPMEAPPGSLLGAEILCFTPNVAETLILNEWAAPPGEDPA